MRAATRALPRADAQTEPSACHVVAVDGLDERVGSPVDEEGDRADAMDVV